MKEVSQIITFIYNHSLARKHKFKAFTRFIIWQLQYRLSHKFHKKRFIGDLYFNAKKGLTGITGNIYVGLHEFEDMAFMIHFLRPKDVFFDVGANVGAYTLLASGITKATSLAFEPSLETIALLRENVKLNKLEHLVNCINVGIGKKKDVLWFTTNQDTTNHFLYNEDKETESIQIETLDSYQFHPSLLKIDVEGFESDVLSGAVNILKSNELKAIIIELNGSGLRYGHRDDEIHKTLINFGYTPYQYDPFTRSLSLLKKYGNINTIYIKDLDFVKSRLKTATPFKIFCEKI